MIDMEPVERDRRLYVDALAAFDQGAFYDCHELLEDLWLRNRSQARPFFQGLIQLAAAFHLLERGRDRGARALFGEARRRLSAFGASYLGLDLAHLLHETRSDTPVRLRYAAPSLDEFWPHRGVSPHPMAGRK